MAKGKKNDADQGTPPTLGEAWKVLGDRLGLAVLERGPLSIEAKGTIRNRSVTVSIEAKQGGAILHDFLSSFARAGSRNRRSPGKVKWHTELSVGCVNPERLTGSVVSDVDANAPGWTPGNYDPRHGRSVHSDSTALAAKAISATVSEKLMSIYGDAYITVESSAIRIIDDGTSRIDGDMVSGSKIHSIHGTYPRWPERAFAGPPWWIELLCDIAEAVDS